ncbi:MAG: hypothetical protein KDK35_07710 [Leptospiraceae bacterium]|nr:hypothetical protein [Leptospiraceae bacterium]
MLKKLKLYATLTLILVLLLAGGTGAYFYYGNYSTGSRSGRLIKLSHRGFLFSTWEGQLDMGGISGNLDSRQLSSIWDFSVSGDDEALLASLDQNTGRRVKLYYDEKFIHVFWRGDTKYFVTRMELLE